MLRRQQRFDKVIYVSHLLTPLTPLTPLTSTVGAPSLPVLFEPSVLQTGSEPTPLIRPVSASWLQVAPQHSPLSCRPAADHIFTLQTNM